MRRHAAIATAALLAAAGIASAQELRSRASPPGHGVALRSGSRVTTTFDDDLDVDDYVFGGYPGAKIRATLRRAEGSHVHGHLELVRPDGTVVAAADEGARFRHGAEVMERSRFQIPDTAPPQFEDRDVGAIRLTSKIRFTLDQVGAWKLRVRVPDLILPAGDPATYTLAARFGGPRSVRVVGAAPDWRDELTYTVPARGGATLSFRLAYRAGRGYVGLNSIRDPDGGIVDASGRLRYRRNRLSARRVVIPDDLTLGDYRVTFDAADLEDTVFTATVRAPQSGARLRGRLDGREPAFSGGILPSVGGPGTAVAVEVVNAIDENDPEGSPQLLLGGREVAGLTVTPLGPPGSVRLRGTVPADLPDGVHDVVARTSRGQEAVLADGFTRVPPPVVAGVSPDVGTVAGGFEVTLTGTGFRPGHVAVAIDGSASAATIVAATPTSVRFVAPAHAEAQVRFAVLDTETGLVGTLTAFNFTYVSRAAIARVTPGIVPILGGETVGLVGFNFREDDRVFLETSTPGEFEEITATQVTYRDAGRHEFVAPVRPRGRYEVYIEDATGRHSIWTRTLDVFEFGDLTPQTGLGDGAGAGWTTALSDFDGDGDTDLFVARRGSGPRQAESQLSLFENDGSGGLTDATERLPGPTTTDDWRADRIRIVDVTMDGFPDVVMTTDDLQVPAPTASHTRILVSERRSESAAVDDRVFRDATFDLMATPRRGKSGVSNTDGDNWRGLDLWVGDIDGAPDGRPEIVITHKDLKEEVNVYCGNYCNTGQYTYGYSFYWGGSRTLTWSPWLRGGQGRYRFEPNFFPRRAGLTVPIFNPPPGVTIPVCNEATPCRGTFTPFTGHTLVVRDLDGDGRRDVVVVSDESVRVNGSPTSSTQVALNAYNPMERALVTDMTPRIALLAGETRADTATILDLDGADGSPGSTLVLARHDAPVGGGPALRLIRFVPPVDVDDPGSFEDVTVSVLAATTGGESWQATALDALDVDADGDEDLVLLSETPPEPGASALRILRNVAGAPGARALVPAYEGLLPPFAPGGDPFDGRSLTIGDLDGDGLREYVVTRATPAGQGPQTRAMATER